MKPLFLFSFLALFMGCNIGEPVETSPKQYSKPSKHLEDGIPNTSVVSKTPWYQHPATLITGIVGSVTAIGIGIWRWVVGKQVETEAPKNPLMWVSPENLQEWEKFPKDTGYGPDTILKQMTVGNYYANEFVKIANEDSRKNRLLKLAMEYQDLPYQNPSHEPCFVIGEYFHALRDMPNDFGPTMDAMSDVPLVYILSRYGENEAGKLKEYLDNKAYIEQRLNEILDSMDETQKHTVKLYLVDSDENPRTLLEKLQKYTH